MKIQDILELKNIRLDLEIDHNVIKFDMAVLYNNKKFELMALSEGADRSYVRRLMQHFDEHKTNTISTLHALHKSGRNGLHDAEDAVRCRYFSNAADTARFLHLNSEFVLRACVEDASITWSVVKSKYAKISTASFNVLVEDLDKLKADDEAFIQGMSNLKVISLKEIFTHKHDNSTITLNYDRCVSPEDELKRKEEKEHEDRLVAAKLLGFQGADATFLATRAKTHLPVLADKPTNNDSIQTCKILFSKKKES